MPATPKSIVAPGLLLGVGIGGFVDGILLHQILQWHHMISERKPPTTLPNLEANTVGDGLFHAATWVAVVLGVFLLYRRLRHDRLGGARLSYGGLVGSLLAGWGIFNLVEGVVNHHLLRLHHVRHGPNELAYDLGFLLFGAVLLAGGWLLVRRSTAR